jgi:hypothetical protein
MSTDTKLDYSSLADLIKELDSILDGLVERRAPSIRTDEVKTFITQHRHVPGFKAVAVVALLEAEERLQNVRSRAAAMTSI